MEIDFDKLENLYLDFMSDNDINISTGRKCVKMNREVRFGGFPYVGENYQHCHRKILFIGLDLGVDERYKDDNYHNYTTKRECVCHVEGLQPHLAGVYVMSLILLNDISDNYRKAWDLISRYNYGNHNYSNKKCINEAIRADKLRIISAEIMKDIAFTNFYKFVSVGRIPRAGGNDRRWYIDRECELKLLGNEIEILNPDIIIFHGLKDNNPDFRAFYKMIDERMPEYSSRLHHMAHPADSYHKDEAGLNHSSLQYTLKHAEEILNKIVYQEK